ncbi:MAG: ribose-5-phosphate isomerase RpiA [Candidatus Jordarchaeum sp.]|uniref:ribose-5-phosphate isomerase RpiA n=1 Tax=Candidatus Jordarchaeum sp. TaxID=2823881 RepID=UPI004049EEB2
MANIESKRRVALAALGHVKDGMVIGVGTGSTVSCFIEILGERVREGLKILAVPTSHQSAILLAEQGVPLTTLTEHPSLDLVVDGADEVDLDLNLIKGGGAALTQEKIVASATECLIIIVDSSKVVKRLGETRGVPVEVIPMAWKLVKYKLEKKGAKVVLREGMGKAGPVVTDNGNFILDVNFPEIRNPDNLERELNSIPGIVENGLFVGLAELVYVGNDKDLKVLRKK